MKKKSKKCRIKIPPEHAVVRALRRLQMPHVKAVCIWCGHRYFKWSDTLQDAHLTRCEEYQRAKRSAS